MILIGAPDITEEANIYDPEEATRGTLVDKICPDVEGFEEEDEGQPAYLDP